MADNENLQLNTSGDAIVIYKSKKAALSQNTVKRGEGVYRRTVRLVKGLKEARAKVKALDYCSTENKADIYGEVFRVPEPFISKVGARIYGLTTPEQKMSKSIPQGCVFLMDEPNVIMKKFKRAITDSDTEHCVRFDREAKPGVANLMNIYATITGKSFEEIEREFDGKGYGVFKPAVGEVVVDTLNPIREEAKRLIADKSYLDSVYREGAEKASYIANKTLRKVYKKIGFYQLDKK